MASTPAASKGTVHWLAGVMIMTDRQPHLGGPSNRSALAGLTPAVSKETGTLACWGDDGDGQATPPSDGFLLPQVSAGGWHTCGIKGDGTVACWGDDADGQATPPGGIFQQVTAGGEHNCGIKGDGTWLAGVMMIMVRLTPPGGTFQQVSAGGWHTCGIKGDGTLACWGNNAAGHALVVKSFSAWVSSYPIKSLPHLS